MPLLQYRILYCLGFTPMQKDSIYQWLGQGQTLHLPSLCFLAAEVQHHCSLGPGDPRGRCSIFLCVSSRVPALPGAVTHSCSLLFLPLHSSRRPHLWSVAHGIHASLDHVTQMFGFDVSIKNWDCRTEVNLL